MHLALPVFLLLAVASPTAPASAPASSSQYPSVDGVMDALARSYPAYRAIEKAEPETYRRMRAIVAGRLAARASVEDIAARMRGEIKEVYLRRLRTAPDELVLAYAGFMEDVLTYLEQHDPKGCASLVSSDAPSGGGYGSELNRRDSDILSHVVTTPPVEKAFASDQEVADAAQSAAIAAGAELHKSPQAVFDALAGQGSPTELCSTWRVFVRQVRRVGTSRPAILRSLLLN
jgi:hypothetical protein